MSVPQLTPRKDVLVFQAIRIARPTFVCRASRLVFADCPSRLASRCSGQPDFCLHDLRIRLTPNGSSCPDFPTASSVAPPSERTRKVVPAKLPLSIAVCHPPGMNSAVDNRKIRCGLRHAPDCDLLAVTGITLSHSARTAHPFGLPFARSITGTPGSPQRPFPAWLQLATGLRQQLRQADCESDFSFALAHDRACSTYSADLFCLQIFPKTAAFRRFLLA